MLYVFISSVFITLFLVVGTLVLMGLLELMRKSIPLNWLCAQHIIILAIIAVLCFIAAIIFGTQIPNPYETTIL